MDYFVEYYPPSEGSISFGILQLTWTRGVTSEEVSDAMEAEFDIWLQRFKVPLMVSAFDSKDDLIDLDESKGSSHIMGFRADDGLKKIWGTISDAELPPEQMQLPYWKQIFSGLVFKTTDDFVKKARDQRRSTKIAVILLFIWLVVIPASVAVLGWASPVIGAIVLVYSLTKATSTGLRLLGKLPQSVRQLEDSEKKRKMEHYYYHCERNPKAFEKLRTANFENEGRQRTKEEFDSIKDSAETTQETSKISGG